MKVFVVQKYPVKRFAEYTECTDLVGVFASLTAVKEFLESFIDVGDTLTDYYDVHNQHVFFVGDEDRHTGTVYAAEEHELVE